MCVFILKYSNCNGEPKLHYSVRNMVHNRGKKILILIDIIKKKIKYINVLTSQY